MRCELGLHKLKSSRKESLKPLVNLQQGSVLRDCLELRILPNVPLLFGFHWLRRLAASNFSARYHSLRWPEPTSSRCESKDRSASATERRSCVASNWLDRDCLKNILRVKHVRLLCSTNTRDLWFGLSLDSFGSPINPLESISEIVTTRLKLMLLSMWISEF